jgi:hypothetical protein
VSDSRAARFSLAGFAVALVTVGVGTAAGLAFVPVVGSYVGMLLGGVLAGLAVEDRPLAEAGTAALLANLGVLTAGTLVGNGVVAAVSAIASLSLATLLTATTVSFAVGGFGAHFGDDLREGLTAPVETPPSGSTTPPAPVPHPDEESATHESTEDVSTTRDTGSERNREPGPESAERGERELERE